MSEAYDSETAKQLFKSCCAELPDQGWSDEDIAEIRACVAVDFAEGPGVEREFAMPLAERRECWCSWFAGKTEHLHRKKNHNLSVIS